MPFKKIRSDDERFFSKVAFDEWNRDDCWLWTGRPGTKGYGKFGIGPARCRRHVMAHRWAYEFFNGPIPKGKELHHNCENRLCVNPNHLEALAPLDHQNRSPKFLLARSRHIVSYRLRTHCPKGHPYTDDNLYVYPKGNRACRQCRREAGVRFRQRRKNARV